MNYQPSFYITLPLMILGGIILLSVANPTAFNRIWSAVNAKIGLLGRWARNNDPISVLQQARDNAAKNCEDAWGALEEKQGLIEQLERVVKSADSELNQLKALADRAVAAGNQDQAKSYLTQMVRITRETADNRVSLDQHRQEYEEYKKVINHNQRKIDECRDEARRLKVNLHVSEAEARLAKAMPNLAGINANELDGAREAVYERIDAARAASKVAKDRMGMTTVMDDLKNGTDEAEAERMLADIKARNGIV